MLGLMVALLIQHSDRLAYAASLKGNPLTLSTALRSEPIFVPPIDDVASGVSSVLRREIRNVELAEGKISPSHAARNLFVSIVLLIGIFVAGSFTIHQSIDRSKPSRQCPFVAYIPGLEPPKFAKSKYEGDGVEDGKSLAEAGFDWDMILISQKFACVFDPSGLPIGNLLCAPPPTFKSKADVGIEHFRNLFTPAEKRFSMNDISIVRGIAAIGSTEVSLSSSSSAPEHRLASVCRKGLKAMQIESLFPVQKICTHLLLSRLQEPEFSPFDCDLCVSAPTGQGKTLAYLLPIVHALAKRKLPVLRALIVLPTRDLALQVSAVAAQFSGLRVSCLIGQTSMSLERSALMSSESCPDIAVATIGRLIDHLVIGSLDLSFLHWLVVDEADRMLSDLDKWSLILGSVPSTTQRLLFSATMTSNPQKLSKLKLTRPLFVSVGGATDQLVQRYVVVPNKSMKVRCLLKILEILFSSKTKELPISVPISRCLVFCNSNENVTSLSTLLASVYKEDSKIVSRSFSGNMTGKAREKLLTKFADGRINCLIATDVITRGIDIADIDVVINYDVPNYATTYVHRAGRTGRAGKSGLAITMCESKEMRHFRKEIAHSTQFERFRIDFSSVIKHADLEGLADDAA